MRRLRVLAVLAMASSCGGAAANARLTPSDIAKRSTPAIVRIEAGNDKVGTGFIVDKTGIVATNLHVVAGEAAIKIKLHDGTTYPVLQVAGLDPARDLALLRIQPSKELPTLKLGDSDAVAAGDQIVAIGNPLGVFDYSVTNGLISQVRPMCGGEDLAAHRCQELTVLQISAAISPGSSGGPLFNQFGEVVGVTTAIITAGQNINLAVPGNYLKPMLAQRRPLSPDQFAKDTSSADEDAPRGKDEDENVQIVRRIPRLEAVVYDGCGVEDIGDIVREISEAIESGAPLYNEGKHEACYRIYEGTALKFEHDVACTGVRTAFGDGLLRANGLKTYKEKAWAMRDTFDGLLEAARRWTQKHPEATKAPRKPKK